jgi:integrase
MNTRYLPGVALRGQKGKRATSLYLDIHVNGTRKREYLRLYLVGDTALDKRTLAVAEDLRLRRFQDIYFARSGQNSVSAYADEDAITYISDLARIRGRNWQTLVSHLRRMFTGSVPFYRVTTEWVEQFRDNLAAKGLSANTINAYMDVLTTALNLAVEHNRLASNPCSRVHRPKRTTTARVHLTTTELERLADATCEHREVKEAFLFACCTGLRISDVRRLSSRDVHEDGVHVYQKKTGDFTHIPLSETASRLLSKRSLRDKEHPLFGLPASDTCVNKHLKHWARSAGITKHITTHTARHTFATLLVERHVDIYTIQQLLGHRDIRMTQRYAKLLLEQKRHAVGCLPTFNV